MGLQFALRRERIVPKAMVRGGDEHDDSGVSDAAIVCLGRVIQGTTEAAGLPLTRHSTFPGRNGKR